MRLSSGAIPNTFSSVINRETASVAAVPAMTPFNQSTFGTSVITGLNVTAHCEFRSGAYGTRRRLACADAAKRYGKWPRSLRLFQFRLELLPMLARELDEPWCGAGVLVNRVALLVAGDHFAARDVGHGRFHFLQRGPKQIRDE